MRLLDRIRVRCPLGCGVVDLACTRRGRQLALDLHKTVCQPHRVRARA